MIPSIHKPGSNTVGAIGYLYRTGRGHEAHTDPHLVASLDGLAPDPARDPQATFRQLAAYLDLPVQAVDPAERPVQHVWHCSVRAAPEDPILTDVQWADIARRIVDATGIAPGGDDGACRWIAVRHADDHIHILATKVRQDGTKPRDSFSYKRAQAETRRIEADYGLRRVTPGDGTAARRPTRAETEKAHRKGSPLTPREQLRAVARTVVAVSTSPEEYLHLLAGSGILVETLRFPSGDIRGYKVALEGDTNAAGQPVWFSGSTLAPDLSYPQIRDRLTTTDAAPIAGPSRPNPWHQATAAIERIPHHLDQDDDPASQAQITAFAEALDVLPFNAPQEIRPHLRQAALDFERASRSRIHSDHQHARTLRNAVRAIARLPLHWRRCRTGDVPRRRPPGPHRDPALADRPPSRPAGRSRPPHARPSPGRLRPGRAHATHCPHPTHPVAVGCRPSRPADTPDRPRLYRADPPRLPLAGPRHRPHRRRDRRPRPQPTPPTGDRPARPHRRPLTRPGSDLAPPTPGSTLRSQPARTRRPSP